MPRKQRFFLPHVPLHIVQCGHAKHAIFFDDEDREVYLDCCATAAARYGAKVYSYVLMRNCVHLLLVPESVESATRVMQHIGRLYVPYINAKYDTSGTLWEGRFKSSLVDDQTYFLACMRYIEMAPVRAGLCDSPQKYHWSSYVWNSQDTHESHRHQLLHRHPIYKALGDDSETRRTRYREFFHGEIPENELVDISAAWQTGTPLGSRRFKNQVEAMLGQKVGQARRGRPSGYSPRKSDLVNACGVGA